LVSEELEDHFFINLCKPLILNQKTYWLLTWEIFLRRQNTSQNKEWNF
jgi:hypothetical protein